MRNLFFSLFIAIFAFGCLTTTVEAKRFGGGKSFGQSRSVSHSNTASRTAAPAAAAKPAGNKWLGPLAGLAVGGLLASLFMGHGMGTGILSWLMIAGVIFVAWRLISRFRQGNRPVHQAAFQPQESGNTFTNAQYTSAFDTSSSAENEHPIDFDEAAFIRRAKTVFIRLQAAYDNKNLADIREFTTPEVFAEIQMQIQERGDEPNQTDVISIDARLLDISNETGGNVASVMFTGLIREKADAEPEAIKETWHFNHRDDQWFISGIQQD